MTECTLRHIGSLMDFAVFSISICPCELADDDGIVGPGDTASVAKYNLTDFEKGGYHVIHDLVVRNTFLVCEDTDCLIVLVIPTLAHDLVYESFLHDTTARC